MTDTGNMGGAMTESQIIRKIRRLASIDDPDYSVVLSIIEEGLAAFPESVKLWCLRGDLINLTHLTPGKFESVTYKAADALNSYETAARLDPTCAEAFEEIGYYWDVSGDDFRRSEAAFCKAIELGAGVYSYYGLARVLAQRGEKPALILQFLDGCPFALTPEIKDIRSEIEEGMWTPDSTPGPIRSSHGS